MSGRVPEAVRHVPGSTGIRAPLRRTLAITRGERRRVAAAVALGAAALSCAIGLLASSAWLLSRAAEHPSIAYLGLAIALVRFFAVARGLFRYGERLVGHDAAFRVLSRLRVRSYEQLEPLAPNGLAAFRSGDLLARLVGDIDATQDVVLRVIPPFATAVVVGIATVGFVAVLSPNAAAVLAVTLVLGSVALPLLTGRLARRSDARHSALQGELTAAVVDLVEGADELAVNGATAAQLDHVRRTDAALRDASRASARTAGIGAGLAALLMGAAILGTLLVGVPAVANDDLSGVWLATIVLLPLATFEIISGLPAATQSLERVRSGAARVFAISDATPAVEEPVSPLPAPSPPYSLQARGLRVAYRGSDRPALEGVDLDLDPGRRVALLGPSGAGKSTLAQTLVGFLAYEGSVAVDGREVRGLAGEDLRRVVGLVAQDSHVFDTTVRENLLIGRRDATDRDLHDVLERVRLADFVDRLGSGLDTRVGPDASALSGGQRQRLVVARALLANFPVLVLDEPAEHLDAAAADALSADLLDATRNQTTLLITHRFFGLDEMDEIVVLDAGRIAERGTHRDLCAAGGWYAHMYAREQDALLSMLERTTR